MAGGVWQRGRFMAGLILTVARRALPQRAARVEDDEPLIEALQSGDIAALDRFGPGLAKATNGLGTPWFFIALESGSLASINWFLALGASPTALDQSGRLPLEAVIQRASLGDEFDDHLADCPVMLERLVAAGADLQARTLQGVTLAELARSVGLTLPE